MLWAYGFLVLAIDIYLRLYGNSYPAIRNLSQPKKLDVDGNAESVQITVKGFEESYSDINLGTSLWRDFGLEKVNFTNQSQFKMLFQHTSTSKKNEIIKSKASGRTSSEFEFLSPQVETRMTESWQLVEVPTSTYLNVIDDQSSQSHLSSIAKTPEGHNTSSKSSNDSENREVGDRMESIYSLPEL